MEENKMQIIRGFCVREILDEIVAIPTGPAALRFSGVISLNELGKFLFELLEQEQTLDSLVAAVTDSYDVDEQTARTDVEGFVQSLRERQLLIEG